MGKRWPAHVVEALIVLIAVGLAFVGILAGWVVGHATRSQPRTVTLAATASAPPGHVGAGLAASVFGDPAKGARLFVSKHCVDCHSYSGKGGTDAPPLDYMKGHISAREIAEMSGDIWNHLPHMLPHFKQEHIPVPTFTGGEMADLVAYLHSGKGPAPAQGGMQMGTTTGAMPMPAAKTRPGNPARGKAVFVSSGCGGCHTLAAAGTKGTVGPNLEALTGKSPAFIRLSIVAPNAVIAKGYNANVMPQTYANQLSAQQLADLIAFLQKR